MSDDNGYRDGFDDVIYLVSSLPTVTALDCRWVASDRNAALAVADFCDDEDTLRRPVSWEVISARYWSNYPDGADLRAAELLIHESTPWRAVEMIGTRTSGTMDRVTELLSGSEPPVGRCPT